MTWDFFFRSVFRPLGIYLGLRASRRRKAPTNDVLEQAYMSSKTKVCLPFLKINQLFV